MSSAFTKTSSRPWISHHEQTAGVSWVSLCKVSLVINKVSLVMNEGTEGTREWVVVLLTNFFSAWTPFHQQYKYVEEAEGMIMMLEG